MLLSTLLLLFRKLVIVYPILHYVSFKAQILSHLINEKLAPVRISLKLSLEKVSLAQSEFASDPRRSLLFRCEFIAQEKTKLLFFFGFYGTFVVVVGVIDGYKLITLLLPQ